VILVDSNIPMYLVGAAHPNKDAARRALEEAVAAGESLCADAEVLQEILHRYTAIRRPDDIDPAFDALLAIVDVVYPIERADVERARRLLRTTATLSARDAVHIALCL
jgi:predicted nucleic acid-binding protein